jgi:hypothetical protein
MMKRTIWGVVCALLIAAQAEAIVICQKGKKLRLRESACTSKETLAQDLALAAQPGPKGDPGDPGAAGTARAYAEVDAAGPSLVAARTKGFTGVTSIGAGLYCLAPEAGISPTTNPAVVSASGPLTANAYAYTAPPTGSCPDGYVVAVKEGVSLASDVDFTIIVP